jgi:predicted Zn-dependent protease
MPNIIAPSLHARLLASMRAEMRLARGDPARALKIVDALIATTPDLPPGQAVPRLWHQRGRARAALGEVDKGIVDLQRACTGSTAHGTLPLVWRMQVDLARLYDSAGRHREAEQARVSATALVARLAEGVADPAWRAQFVEQATLRINRKD